MAAVPSEHRTILFVDVVASVELYADLGDAGARARVGPCLEEFSHLIERQGGTIVKFLGDGILAAFEDERAAVDTAMRMVADAPSHQLQVAIGVHTGEVIVEESDVFGQAVNVASRLSAKARPAEILVSREVMDCLSPGLRAQTRPLHGVAIKGLAEPMELFALSDDASSPGTTISAASDDALLPPPGMELRIGDRRWDIHPGKRFHLGRDPSNDLVVSGGLVSRQHAVIASRHGKYVIVDRSVNGTWLVPDDGSRLHLLREEEALHGAGRIVLGVQPDDPLAVPISYRALS
jgi:class 3 adenylate cyclase